MLSRHGKRESVPAAAEENIDGSHLLRKEKA